MAQRLEGKVALITGAAMGQGAAEARLFAQHGARVAVTDIADTADVATALGDVALALSLDVTQESQWAGALAATVEKFGRLDILDYQIQLHLDQVRPVSNPAAADRATLDPASVRAESPP